MSFVFDVNNAAMTGGVAIFKLKELLKTAGWTVRSSGDGLSAFSSSTDVITGGASGANGLANTNAWFVVEMPTANSVLRQLMFQRGSTNAIWTVKYSYSAKFTGGSPSATVAGTATDSQTLLNNTTLLPADSTYRWNVVADNASPYGFWSGSFATGGGNPSSATCMFPLTQTDSLDIDPYVFYVSSSVNSFSALSDLSSGAGLFGYMRKGMTNERFNGGANPPVLAHVYKTSIQVIPGSVGANPHNGNDDSFDVPIGNGALVNSNAIWPGGFKGLSSTFLRWNGSSKTTGDTLSVASAGAKDRIAYRDCNLPWNGSTPTV